MALRQGTQGPIPTGVENTQMNDHPLECMETVFRSDTEWLVQIDSRTNDEEYYSNYEMTTLTWKGVKYPSFL